MGGARDRPRKGRRGRALIDLEAGRRKSRACYDETIGKNGLRRITVVRLVIAVLLGGLAALAAYELIDYSRSECKAACSGSSPGPLF